MIKGLLLTCFLWICTQAELPPPYLKPCSKSAADFKKCCVDHGNAAILGMAKGDKKFGVPSLTPLKLESLDASKGNGLKIVLSKVDVFGLNNVKLSKVDIDFKTNSVSLAGKIDGNIELVGDYEVDGKILVLPIQGHGKSNITGANPSFTYDLKFKIEPKNGAEYMVLLNEGDNFKYELTKAHFQLDNLFNGDEKLGNNVNTFLNENWQDVVKELGEAFGGVIKTVAFSIASSLFKKITYKELFLP